MFRFSLIALVLTTASPALAGEVVHLGKSHGAVQKRHKSSNARLSFYFKYGGTPAAVAYLRAFPKGGEVVRNKQGTVGKRRASVTHISAAALRPARVELPANPLLEGLRETLASAMLVHYWNSAGVLAKIEKEAVKLGHVGAKSGRQEIAFSAAGYRTKGRQRALAQVEISPEGHIEVLGLQLGWRDAE